jgi:hypothetical protein
VRCVFDRAKRSEHRAISRDFKYGVVYQLLGFPPKNVFRVLNWAQTEYVAVHIEAQPRSQEFVPKQVGEQRKSAACEAVAIANLAGRRQQFVRVGNLDIRCYTLRTLVTVKNDAMTVAQERAKTGNVNRAQLGTDPDCIHNRQLHSKISHSGDGAPTLHSREVSR